MSLSPSRDPFLSDRPPGSRRPYSAAKMAEVRRLVETTLYTHVEIAKRTGVTQSAVGRWSLEGKWMRPGFAPRSTRTVPAWRAGRTRRRRMLAVRLVTLAERTVRALEAASAVDAARLREARALLTMAKLATGPHTPRARLLAAVRPVAEAKPRARVIADPEHDSEKWVPVFGKRSCSNKKRASGIVGTPGKTVARNARRARRAPPDFAVEGTIEDARQDARPRQPHPAAIRRDDDVRLPRQK
jgi:hypothetical protein